MRINRRNKDVKNTLGRFHSDQAGVKLGSTWGQPGHPVVKLGSTWGKPGVNLHRPALAGARLAASRSALRRSCLDGIRDLKYEVSK